MVFMADNFSEPTWLLERVRGHAAPWGACLFSAGVWGIKLDDADAWYPTAYRAREQAEECARNLALNLPRRPKEERGVFLPRAIIEGWTWMSKANCWGACDRDGITFWRARRCASWMI